MLGLLVTCTPFSQAQAMALGSSFARAAHLPSRCAKQVRAARVRGGARGWLRCVPLLFFSDDMRLYPRGVSHRL